jgi:Caspase domain
LLVVGAKHKGLYVSMIARMKFALRVVFRAIIVFSLCIMPMSGSQAQSGNNLIEKPRLALVIGNSNYANLPTLKNPRQDAALVASTLRDLGFEVVERSDLTKKSFEAAIREVAKKASDHEAVLFYYAGHGFQLDGRNFLVPVDARLNDRKRIGDETLVLDDIIGKLHDDGRQTLFFLDACRNNPLPVSAKGEKLSEGLAQVETGRGTFVAFATQPGNITNDGAGAHSPFSLALVEHMETGGISISDMMIRVRNSVEEQTLDKQTPWDQSSLRSQFYFKPLIEDSETLTEDDLGLLTQLDPVLLEKFQKRFGLNLPETGAESALPLIANVRPTLLIEEADPDLPTDSDRPVDDPVDVAKLEAEPTVPLARSTAEPAAVEPGLLILDADEDESPSAGTPDIGQSAAAIALAKLPKIAVPAEKPASSQLTVTVPVKKELPTGAQPKVVELAPPPKAKADPQVIAAAKPIGKPEFLPAPAQKSLLDDPTLKGAIAETKIKEKSPVTSVQVPLVPNIPVKTVEPAVKLAMADSKPVATSSKQIFSQDPKVSTAIQETSKLEKAPFLPDPSKKDANETSVSDKLAKIANDTAANIQLTVPAKQDSTKLAAPDVTGLAVPSAKTSRVVPALPDPSERKKAVALTMPGAVTVPRKADQPLAKAQQPEIKQAQVPAPVQVPPPLSTGPAKNAVVALAKTDAGKATTSASKPIEEAKPTDQQNKTASEQIDLGQKEAGILSANTPQPLKQQVPIRVSPPLPSRPDGGIAPPKARIETSKPPLVLAKPIETTKLTSQVEKPASSQVSLAPKLTPTSARPTASATKNPRDTLSPTTDTLISPVASGQEGEKGRTSPFDARPSAGGIGKSGADTLMAALDPSRTPDKVFEASKVPTPLIPEAAIEDQKPSEAKQREFAIRAQKELERLGCYRSALDGNWSARSARALLRYYAERKISPDEVEPSQKLIDRLSAEQTVVCKTTKVEKPKQNVQKPDRSQPKAKAATPQKNSVVRTQPAPNVAKPKSAQPAAKRPKPVETTKTAPSKPPGKKPGAAPIVGLFR